MLPCWNNCTVGAVSGTFSQAAWITEELRTGQILNEIGTQGNVAAILLKREQAAWNKVFFCDLRLKHITRGMQTQAWGYLLPTHLKYLLKNPWRSLSNPGCGATAPQPLALLSLGWMLLPWDSPHSPGMCQLNPFALAGGNLARHLWANLPGSRVSPSQINPAWSE